MMRISFVSVSAIAMVVAVVSFSYAGRQSPVAPTTPMANAEGTKLLGRLPAAFVPNLGQWEHPARYVTRVGAMTVFLEENGWTFTLVERRAEKGKASEPTSARGVGVRMSFVGGTAAELVAEDRLPGRHNYFLGNDPTKWRSDVPLYRSVRYRDVHPGVDVRAREHEGRFEYDLLLQPGANLDHVEIAVEGIERMHVDADDALVLETAVGPVRMPPPLSWEEGPSGERSLITCRYVLRGEGRFGFEAAGRRPGWALVVDPGLVWSTFLGGMGDDNVNALALDTQGAATVVGMTPSFDFPTTTGAFDTTPNGNPDAFVTRLSPTGSSLVYSTFLGGANYDYALAVALDPQGGATVTGSAQSTNFPITPGAFDTSFNGPQPGGDAFVTRLSPTGTSLVYSTFLGGTVDEWATAVAIDAQGAATVAGVTRSGDFPTTPGAFDTSWNGSQDAFVTRLSPTGSSLVYSTFLGGTGGEGAAALALDSQGGATVVGGSDSPDFPTTSGAFDTTHNGRADAFITRLSPAGSSVVYSTFLGGTGGDGASALAIDPQGGATVVGSCDSPDFPTTSGAFDTTHNGNADAFATRLSPTGTRLTYSTFLGGANGDGASSVAVDAQGAASLVGFTGSTNFPTTPGAFDTSYNGGTFLGDGFVARLTPAGTSLVYSTFLGGTGNDEAVRLALDAHGIATVVGYTTSSSFPTTPGAFDTSHNGGTTFGEDGFVTRLDMLPTGAAAFGQSSPGCNGPLAISVTSMPQVGNASFALTCGNAPPQAMGLLLFTVTRFANPVVVLGTEVWINPSLAYWPVSVGSNQTGASEVPVPIPNVQALRSMRLFAQFFWAGPTSPPPCPPLGLSASHALDITIQP